MEAQASEGVRSGVVYIGDIMKWILPILGFLLIGFFTWGASTLQAMSIKMATIQSDVVHIKNDISEIKSNGKLYEERLRDLETATTTRVSLEEN